MLKLMIRVGAALGLVSFAGFALLSVFFFWAVVSTFTRQSTVYSLVVFGATGFYILLCISLFRKRDRVRSLVRILQGKEQG